MCPTIIKIYSDVLFVSFSRSFGKGYEKRLIKYEVKDIKKKIVQYFKSDQQYILTLTISIPLIELAMAMLVLSLLGAALFKHCLKIFNFVKY